MDLVLVGVEGLDGGVAFAEIEDEDFTARGPDGQRHSVRHQIQCREAMVRADRL